MKNIRLHLFYPFILILIALAGRAAFLEYMDLIDPTEARYATVAQIMVTTGNWLTPMLPMPEGVMPYLGKPPLHFWATALSYQIFGIDEWSARLPSLLSTMLLLSGIMFITRRFYNLQTAVCACLIFISSGMAFFLSGASVTDVTLTAMVTLSIICGYAYINRTQSSQTPIVFSALFAAGGFLTKGPVALVLIVLPFVLYSCIRRDFKWILKIPWFKTSVVFLAVTLPWFVLNEISNPGFMKYFFWNENIARYLFKNYGDKYGTGHVHTYGMAWLMLVCAFMPWTIFLAAVIKKLGWKELKAIVSDNPEILFLSCWAVSTPLFFTFVRQLHGMYLLPAIPPFSIITAILCYRYYAEAKENRLFVSDANTWINIPLIAGSVVSAVGLMLQFSLLSLAISLVTLMAGYLVLIGGMRISGIEGFVSRLSAVSILFYLLVIGSYTGYINTHRSCEIPLQQISLSDDCGDNDNLHSVGISSKNAYSPYWTSGAWENELSEKVDVKYIAAEEAGASKVCHYLYKGKNIEEVPASLKEQFQFLEKSGDWLVYARK